MELGEGPGSPTIQDQNSTGTPNQTGSDTLTPCTSDRRTFVKIVTATFAGAPFTWAGCGSSSGAQQ